MDQLVRDLIPYIVRKDFVKIVKFANTFVSDLAK